MVPERDIIRENTLGEMVPFSSWVVQKTIDLMQQDAWPRAAAFRTWRKAISYSTHIHFDQPVNYPGYMEEQEQAEQSEAFVENLYQTFLLRKQSNLIFAPKPIVYSPSSDSSWVDKAEKTRKMLLAGFRTIKFDQLFPRIIQCTTTVGNCATRVFIREDRGRKVRVPIMGRQEVETSPGGIICMNGQCGWRLTGMDAGTRACPTCGSELEYLPPVRGLQDVVTGYEDRQAGEVCAKVYSPFKVMVDWAAEEMDEDNVTWLILFEIYDRAVAEDKWPHFNFTEVPRVAYDSLSHPTEWLKTLKYSYPDLSEDPSEQYRVFGAEQFKDKVEIVQVWLLPCQYRKYLDAGLVDQKFSRGMKVTLNGGRVVEMVPAELHNEWTFWKHLPVLERFYADGEFSILRQQDVLNTLYTLICMSIFYQGVGWLLADPSIVDVDALMGSPQIVYKVKPGSGRSGAISNAIHHVSTSGTGMQNWVPFYQMMRNSFPDLTGTMPIADVQQALAGSQTAFGAWAVRQQMINSLRPIILQIHASAQRFSKQLLLHQKEAWTEPHLYYPDKSEVNEFLYAEEIKSEDILDDPEIFFEPVSWAPEGEFEHRQLVADALGRGLLNMNDPRVNAQVLSIFGLMDFNPDYAVHTRRARRKIQRILNDPMDRDEHTIPWYEKVGIDSALDMPSIQSIELLAFMNSERAEKLKEADPIRWMQLRNLTLATLAADTQDLMEAARYMAQGTVLREIEAGIEEIKRQRQILMSDGSLGPDTPPLYGVNFYTTLQSWLRRLPEMIGGQQSPGTEQPGIAATIPELPTASQLQL